MVYVQAQIKLHPGKQTEFVSLLNTLMPLLNKHGWKLIGSFSAMVGRFNTVLDLWEFLIQTRSSRCCPIRPLPNTHRRFTKSSKTKC